jgi:ubiquitin C-terminal hydrolase
MQVACTGCEHTSNKYVQEITLRLHLEPAFVTSVETAIRHYMAENVLKDDNAVNCETCGHVAAHQKFTIHVLPNVLVLQVHAPRQSVRPSRCCEGAVPRPLTRTPPAPRLCRS